MTRQPTLFLTVGLPCTGKTTAARRIEIEQKALRLTKDEWVKALYGHENPPSAQDVIEGRLIQIGLRALELGNNVVIDYGLWGRDERSALRQAAADLGAMAQMRYFELTPAEQRRRLDQRQAEAPHTTWPMSDEELAGWAASIDIPTPANSTAVNPLMTRRLDSRHGTSGADTAGRCRSPDACSSQRCRDRSSDPGVGRPARVHGGRQIGRRPPAPCPRAGADPCHRHRLRTVTG
jgi:predicted kinase